MTRQKYIAAKKTLKDCLRVHLWSIFLLTSVLLLIILPLFQKGTFIDGMLYKTVSFNYSIGESGFWNMKYTNTCLSSFCEQPPVYFSLLGNFYKVFGSHYLSDRFFTLILFAFLVVLIYAVIKLLKVKKLHSFLLTVFFLVAIPVFCWSYVNQVIEPLVNCLIALTILLFLKFISNKKKIYVLWYSLCIFLLFLSKGFQSCFIALLPVFYYLLAGLNKRVLYFTLSSSVFLLGLIYFTIKIYPPGTIWFNCYYESRLLLTMQNIGRTTDYHLEIVFRFFTELLVCLLFLLSIIGFVSYKKKYPVKLVLKNFASNRLAFSLLLVSLVGSFPFAISLVQRGFYLVPSFICFVLSIVAGFKRYWIFLYAFLAQLARLKVTRILVPTCALFSLAFTVVQINNYKRDQLLLQDIDHILPFLQEGDTVLISGDLWNYFNLHSYLYMRKKINLSAEKINAKFLLLDKKASSATFIKSYSEVNIKTEEINLLKAN